MQKYDTHSATYTWCLEIIYKTTKVAFTDMAFFSELAKTIADRIQDNFETLNSKLTATREHIATLQVQNR